MFNWMRLGLACAGAVMLAACANDEPDVSTPEAFEFGASVVQIEANLEGLCDTQNLREISPPQIPGSALHQQIDCQGFEYFGDKRLAELVFGDDKLLLVWVLVNEDELDAMDEVFSDRFGDPTFKSDTIALYENGFSAVRRDVPEALYYSPDIADLVKAMASQ